MTNAPRFVSNQTLHTDLRIPYVRTVFQERIAKHRSTLISHPNPFLQSLLQLTYHTTDDSNDDGHSTGYTKDASLDAFLSHRQP
jgi:hypothetical protein